MLELFEPVILMAILWSCGIVTGLGIGAAMGRDMTDRKWHRDLFEEEDQA